MGVDQVLICYTCKVVNWTGFRIILNYDGRKAVSGKVTKRKISRLRRPLEKINRIQKELVKMGISDSYTGWKYDNTTNKIKEILGFLERHEGHDVSITGNFDDVPDPNDSWYADQGWKHEELQSSVTKVRK